MKIICEPGVVQLKIEEAVAGALSTGSRESAVEFAEVLEVGDECGDIKKGNNVFVKSWAIDIINHKGKKYHFCHVKTRGILAIVK